jgi:multisubunit Na+/H+ antiporter MnhC subunit
MSAVLHSPERSRTVIDRLGAFAALLCAVHCAALPLMAGVLPLLGLGLLASDGFELAFVLGATAMGTTSALLTRAKHGRFYGMPFLLPGLTLLWAGRWVDVLHHDPIPHAVVMTAGGVLVAVAHIVNLRLAHGHVHDAGCAHGHVPRAALGPGAHG